MSDQHTQTLIIGAGQAGLTTAYHLQRRGLPCLVLDAADRVGDQWRAQWDSLRLYTPAKYDGLPGLPFPADAWDFPGKDQVADYLERYAVHFDLPVRMNTPVGRLSRHGEGFRAEIDDGTITCDNVVVATGSFGRKPLVPDIAADLDPRIVQLHSSEYRRPEQLPRGRVLVVGASHSGLDIAHEVAESHPTSLSGRDCGQIPVDLGSRRGHLLLPVMVFVFRHVLTRRTPMGRKEMDEVRFHGGPALRVKRADLEARGVEWSEHKVAGVADGLPQLSDGTVVDATSVVWCTGFQQTFGWIDIPVFDERGWPREYRGVVDAAPGLFFCGLSFQYAFSSMVFPGVGRDADYVARKIAGQGRAPGHSAPGSRVTAA
ncbi:MAG: NAD(P)/FAD-dependent oxidoreductase [Nocardioides sp.]